MGKRRPTPTIFFAKFALEFVRENRGNRFFLYIPYLIPHSRYEIPDTDPYMNEHWTEDEIIHAAMVTRMDRDIGRLFALLKELGIDEDTIVFFCSDNGVAQRWEGRFDSSGSLRGRKRDMYEGGIRTPMIVRWPGIVAAGKTNYFPWYFADVLPTLVESGRRTSSRSPGWNQCTSIDFGESQSKDRFLYWEFFENGFQQSGQMERLEGGSIGSGRTLGIV